MRILVLSACALTKSVSTPDRLTIDDFRRGPEHVRERERGLAGDMRSAEDMYSGRAHTALMRGVSAFRAAYAGRGVELDHFIVSAGYGIVPGWKMIAPYEATFSDMRTAEARRWASMLQLPVEFRRVLARPYDLALLGLGRRYLAACELNARVLPGGPTLLFCGSHDAWRYMDIPQLRPVPFSVEDTRRFRQPFSALSAALVGRALVKLSEDITRVYTLPRADDVLAELE
jgi:hypothetical protein